MSQLWSRSGVTNSFLGGTLFGLFSLALGCDRVQLVAVSERPSSSAGQSSTATAGYGGDAGTAAGAPSGSGGTLATGGGNSAGTGSSIAGTPSAIGGIAGNPLATGGVAGTPSATGGNPAATGGTAPMGCGSGGDPCDVGSDCCSGACGTDRLCPIHDGCTLIGERCTSNDACCSKACADPGTGIKVCQAFDGCRPEGEICGVGSRMWSGYCCSGTCLTDMTTQISRCGPNSFANCLLPGEVCDLSRPCCTRDPFQPPPICYTSVVGVQRCLNVPPKTCFTEGSPCHVGGECCTRQGGRHFCLPGDSNASTCSLSCAPIGARCFASRDCCTSGIQTACVYGTCQPSGVSCRQLGQDCLSASDCCNGVCGGELLSCIL